MAILKFFQYFELTSNGQTYSGGSRETAKSITIDGDDVYDVTKTITTAAVKLFDTNNLANFDFLWIENLSTTIAVMIQLTVDAGSTDDDFVFELQAGERFTLVSDDAKFGNTIDTPANDGTEDVIDEIWAQTASGSADVRIFAAT